MTGHELTSAEHDLVGDDPHLFKTGPKGRYCNCFGTCCFDPTTLDCLCDECDCGQHDTYCPPDEVPITEIRLPVAPKPDHACQDCGTEVFRNGTRGRFPSRCPECKEKR